MKKRNILLTLLSAIMTVSLAISTMTAFADTADQGDAGAQKTITLEIFNGNADAVALTGAEAVQDGEDTVISIAPASWASSMILLNDPIDMNKEGAQLCFEIKATGEGTYADVRGVTFASWWNESIKLVGENLNCLEGYVVKKYDLSPTMTAEQLAKFKGLSLATDKSFYVKRVWVEYPNPDYSEDDKPVTEEGVYTLLTEAVSSQQDKSTWQHVATIPSAYSVAKGDKISITYSIDNFPGEKIFDMWVGESKITFENDGSKVTEASGTLEYTFTSSYSGDIKLGLWSNTFTINSATLTIVKHEQEQPASGYDIFTGITEVGEVALNANGTAYTGTFTAAVSGKVISDGTALAFGQLDDMYYISGTNAKTATRATIAMTDITPALLGGGMLQFKAKFDFAGEEGRYAKIRLYYECGQWGEAAYVELPITDYVAGEWKDYTFAIKDFNIELAKNSTFGNPVTDQWFDWTKFVGMGISMGSTGDGDNVASFGDVKITNVENKTITGIETEGAQTEYNAGDEFCTTGLKVYVVFEDESKVEVKNYTYSPAKLGTDTKKVTITWAYGGQTYTADIDVTVISEYKGIKVKTQPTKTQYKAGEKFDCTGMEVVLVNKDDSETVITDYTYYTGMLAANLTSVEIEYQGMTTKVEITVADFENKLSLTSKLFDSNGTPSYGYQAALGSKNYVSQATYDATEDETEKGKMTVTPHDETMGYYIQTPNNSWSTSRAFTDGFAYWMLADLYDEEGYNAMVSITYRTTAEINNSVYFGIGNFESWNVYFHKFDISSYIVADGNWNTMYFDIAEVYGAIDGALWGDVKEEDGKGDVDFRKIVGFAVKSMISGTIDIADVTFNWNGENTAAKIQDNEAPELTYKGELSLTFTEGDAVPTFEASAKDKMDGVVEVIIDWSNGAITDGKLNAGNHTVRIYARDAAGNVAEAITVNVTVESKQAPDTDSSSDSGSTTDSGSGSESMKTKGCKGVVDALPAAVSLLGLSVVYLFDKKRRA